MNKNSNTYERYSRQIILKEFGTIAQEKLMDAKVLVIGAGGLGCAALQYLAAAGVGTLGIIDDDVVALHNLHRQILYTMEDIGSFKVLKAKEKLNALNPEVTIITYNERIHNNNAFKILSEYNIIVDGTDNFASRYLINDACVLLNKPLVYASVSQYEGQVAVFNCTGNTETIATNYRDLFPIVTNDDEILNCAEAGVLGILPGIIGNMQACETIKLITGIGKPLWNTLLTYNLLSNEIHQFQIQPTEMSHSMIPKTEDAFLQMNYKMNCQSELVPLEIEISLFDRLRESGKVEIIDVREPGELPLIDQFPSIHLPLSQINESNLEFTGDTLLLFCQSGKRSKLAAQILSRHFGTDKTIYSLKGGILNWLENRNS